MTENTYFENFEKAAWDFESARDERRKERDAMKEAGNWDGVKAFDEKEKAEHPVPWTNGQMKAWRCYRDSRRNGADTFEVNDLPWDYEIEDFVKTLREAGIKSFTVTDQSTGLMDGIYGLAALGCTMKGLKAVTRADDHRLGGSEPRIENGIEFTIA